MSRPFPAVARAEAQPLLWPSSWSAHSMLGVRTVNAEIRPSEIRIARTISTKQCEPVRSFVRIDVRKESGPVVNRGGQDDGLPEVATIENPDDRNCALKPDAHPSPVHSRIAPQSLVPKRFHDLFTPPTPPTRSTMKIMIFSVENHPNATQSPSRPHSSSGTALRARERKSSVSMKEHHP